MNYSKRAISGAEKQQREETIVNIAEKLFSNADYKDITMAKIAQEAGLAKGTLFLYFRTKEELFLSMAQRSISKWSHEVQAEMSKIAAGKRELPVNEFVDILVNSINDGLLVKLFSMLDDTLEQNIDLDRAIKFKTFLKSELSAIGKLIEAILPDIKEGQGVSILQQLFICVIGSYKVSNTSQIVKQAAKIAELEMFDIDFYKTLRGMATCHILGYIAVQQNK